MDFLSYILYFCTPALLWIMMSNEQRSKSKFLIIMFLIIVTSATQGYFFISHELYHGENPEDYLSAKELQIFNAAGGARTILFITWIFQVFQDAPKRNKEE